MPVIKKIIGREILDSRGYPTVEAEVHLQDGSIGVASSPSGASVGKNESLELRDHDRNRFFGRGVLAAVHAVNHDIFRSLVGKKSEDQRAIDHVMIGLDGSEDKSKLGANAILSVSLANAKAAALSHRMPLYEYISFLNETPREFSMPLPMINVLNGGKHADNGLDIQEFMIQPIGASDMKHAVQMGSEVFHALSRLLKNRRLSTTVGDEGGYAPQLECHRDALRLMRQAVRDSSYSLGDDVSFAIDCAASEFYSPERRTYFLRKEDRTFSSREFTHFLEDWVRTYPITSIEDGLSEEDWEGYRYQTKTLGNRIQLVGDDLFTTNRRILKKGIARNVANSVLVKLNQVGSLTETLDTMKTASACGYATVVSHRSGETEDTFIADLAVGTSAGQIKTGSMSRSERTAKYNRLIRIAEELPHVGFCTRVLRRFKDIARTQSV